MIHDVPFVKYFIILHAVKFSLYQSLEWEQWSWCSKSCDVGTRSRYRYDNTTKQTEVEKQYCNFQYCPDIIKRCNSSVDRYCSDVIIHHGYPICRDNKCLCQSDFYPGGPEYNEYNCMIEMGNCIMRDDPPSALGFADPSLTYTSRNSLYSCTTNDNNATEVHVIGIGHSDGGIFDVTIFPRGPTDKPIILALTSNAGITWRIKTSVQIKELLFTNNYNDVILREYGSSGCILKSRVGSNFMFHGYGYDLEGDFTVANIKRLETTFGPITSFTGYERISTKHTKNIILKVGGDPLSVTSRDYIYEPALGQCKKQLTCKLLPGSKTPTKQEPWSQWTACSKSCGIGKIRRERCVLNKDVIESQEYYCNFNHCPAETVSCTSSPCALVADNNSSGICINGTCRCPLGANYTADECYKGPGNCSIYIDSPIALGSIEPPVTDQNLYSCINRQNTVFEVHVVSVYGNQNYDVSVIPIGQVSKPIILVFASYKPVNWTLNMTVGIYELVFGDYSNQTSTSVSSKSRCGAKLINNTLPITKIINNDVDLTSRQLLTEIVRKYGPVTSYMGYHKPINGRDSFHMKLRVGGDPFAVLSKDYVYDIYSVSCTPIEPTTTTTTTTTTPQPTTTAMDHIVWSPWTKCSKDCDVGIRSRRGVFQRSNKSITRKQYCNLHYCPVRVHTCYRSKHCQLENFPIIDGRCENGMCVCRLGTGYHPTNCLPVFGNCTIRKNSKLLLEHIYWTGATFSDMYSCTADDNPVYEVHVVAVHSRNSENQNVNITVKQRGPVTKPIVIVLTSYNLSKWWVLSGVPLYKVITNDRGSVAKSPSSLCDFKPVKTKYSYVGHGDDRNGGNTIELIEAVTLEYGPITSFTGFNEFVASSLYPTITIYVGGDPLSTKPYEINSPPSDCTPVLPVEGVEIPPLPPPATFAMILPVSTTTTETTMATAAEETNSNIVIAVIVAIFVIFVCIIIGCCIARKKSSTPRSRPTVEQDETNRLDRPNTTPSAPPVELTEPETRFIPSGRNNYAPVPNDDSRIYSDDPPSYESVMKMTAKESTSL